MHARHRGHAALVQRRSGFGVLKCAEPGERVVVVVVVGVLINLPVDAGGLQAFRIGRPAKSRSRIVDGRVRRRGRSDRRCRSTNTDGSDWSAPSPNRSSDRTSVNASASAKWNGIAARSRYAMLAAPFDFTQRVAAAVVPGGVRAVARNDRDRRWRPATRADTVSRNASFASFCANTLSEWPRSAVRSSKPRTPRSVPK